MRAVFLHVLGDALGSVVVIISAILIKFIEEDWKYKIDPVLRYICHSSSSVCFHEICVIIRPIGTMSSGRASVLPQMFFFVSPVVL